MLNEPRLARQRGHSVPLQGNLPFDSLRGRLDFFRGFVRHPAQVGSITPSSSRLEQRLVREARLNEARTVVELGPGTGGTTTAFLRAMCLKAQLLAIELDADFYDHLSVTIEDSRFILELGSAARLEALLTGNWLPPPDAIISGIPFSTMLPEVSDHVAAAIARVLRPGGRFVAYQVRGHVADYVSPYLGPPAMQWEMMNVPPVRVFTWVKRN